LKSQNRAGGLLTYGIPNFKPDKETDAQGSYLAMEFLTAIQKKNFGEEYDQI